MNDDQLADIAVRKVFEPKEINAELEFLRDFFDAWESFQKIAHSDCHGDKKQLAAQNLVNAANCVRNLRSPVQGLVPNG